MGLREKGFTLVEGLLVGVIILLLGGVGFYVYNANTGKSSNKAQEERSVVAQKDELSQDLSQEQVEGQAKKLLAIKELGITLDLKDSQYDDITYTMTSVNQGGSKNIAAVYSQSLHKELLAACGQDCVNNPYGLNMAVSVYFYDSANDQYGDAPTPIDPAAKNSQSKLFAGFTSVVDPAGDNATLSNKWLAFRDYIVKIVEKI